MTLRWLWIVKEVRGLLPLWAACTLAILIHIVVDTWLTRSAALLAYVLGTAALGAYAIGDEIGSRTLNVLLVQPVARRSLLAAKLIVLAVMLTTMGVLGWFAFLDGPRLSPPMAMPLLLVLAGLFAAPWVTMVTRNPLAGIMFPIAAAALLFLAINAITPAFVVDAPLVRFAPEFFGRAVLLDDAEAARLAFFVWSRGVFALLAVAGVLSWRTFMRYEVIEGPQAGIQLPRWMAADDTLRTPGAFGRLVRKEIYLQQMTFALVVVYVIGWIVLYASVDAANRDGAFFALTSMYVLAVSLVAGSLASAEERNLGLLETQRLLPVSAWQQWGIKLATTFAVVLLAGLVVPGVLLIASGLTFAVRENLTTPLVIGGAMMMVASISLYVSSLSNSATKAVGFAFLGAAAVAAFTSRTMILFFANPGRMEEWPLWTSLGAFAGLLVVFAGMNHNSSERNLWHASVQMAAAAVIIPVGIRFVFIATQYW